MALIKRLTFLFLLLPLCLIGQYSNTIHYTVKDGLPSSTVYTVSQDNKGFIWMGTEAGLVRYDGTNFKTYTTEDGLPDNEVLHLLYDARHDRLWIHTYSKKSCYYHSGVFYTDKNDSSLGKIKIDIGEFLSGNITCYGEPFLFAGPYIYKYGHNGVIRYGFNSRSAYQVRDWSDSTYEVITENGVELYKSRKFQSLLTKPITESNVTVGFWLDNDVVFASHEICIFYSRNSNGTYKYKGKIDINGKSVSSVVRNGADFLISLTNTGIYAIDTLFKHPCRQIWKGNATYLYKDKDNALWIPTKDEGIYVLRQVRIRNFTVDSGDQHNNINALTVDSAGKIYFGNSLGEIYSVTHDSIKNVVSAFSCGYKKIRSLLLDKSDLLFITDGSAYRYNILHQTVKDLGLNSGGLKSLIRWERRKSILIGTVSNLFQFDAIIKSFSIHKRITALAERPDGEVFMGSLDGVYHFKEDSITSINSDERMRRRITSLVYSPDTVLWIGTASDGIIAFWRNHVVAHITPSRYPAFTGRICRKIVTGAQNEIWVASNYGVNKIKYHIDDSLIIDGIIPFTASDGLLSDDVNDIFVKDSILYIATSQGVSVLNLMEMSVLKPIPVYIMSLRINDKDSMVHDREYELTSLQNNIYIQFIGVSPMSGGYLSYEYRLLGSSDKWETTRSTSVELRSLSPGKYTFEVTVLDKFGNRSKQVAKINFVISPAFYQSFWFWGVVFVFALGFGFYMIRRQFRIRQDRYEREQGLNNKIIELEQQALKAQMNPHFIFNCLTAIQHFVNKEDIYSANMYLSNFAKLIRKTLDLSGEQYITLDKEVAYLESYIGLEKMRFQDKFRYSVSVADGIDMYSVIVPPMLLQPIIENAIRHGLRHRDGNEGVLSIAFTQEDSQIVCRIDDNGIGLRRSAELKTNVHVEYQSKGMHLTESRIAAINMISKNKIHMELQSKYDNEGNAAGTIVIVKFEQ